MLIYVRQPRLPMHNKTWPQQQKWTTTRLRKEEGGNKERGEETNVRHKEGGTTEENVETLCSGGPSKL
ncbi:unnamed protein product [Schistosoma curassoni]|uniref:Uncharacterized protein n=1 Tax=Schistosoma curassoni TaxID=6186 RepID=A0A183KWZ7_9TREM|nr:unnamed protein product [Schistosoma curassoni]